MTTVIVLFNLLPGADKQAYENWARESDIPAVRRLGSVSGFEVLRMQTMLSGDPDAPYQYAELIQIDDMDGFMDDVKTDAIREAAQQFRTFADNPQFIVCESIES